MSWYKFVLANFKSSGKNPVEEERSNLLVIYNEISLFNNFNIFVGRLLRPTVLLSFNDEIKFTISFELVSFRKKELLWHAGKIHRIMYLQI